MSLQPYTQTYCHIPHCLSQTVIPTFLHLTISVVHNPNLLAGPSLPLLSVTHLNVLLINEHTLAALLIGYQDLLQDPFVVGALSFTAATVIASL